MNIYTPILKAIEHDNIIALGLTENRDSTVKQISNSRFISRIYALTKQTAQISWITYLIVVSGVAKW